jgi:capsular polysaccharide biosynthesis protein
MNIVIGIGLSVLAIAIGAAVFCRLIDRPERRERDQWH